MIVVFALAAALAPCRVAGIVELPTLFGVHDAPKPVPALDGPDKATAKPLALKAEQLETKEFGYEEAGAVVCDVAAEHFVVKLKDGKRAWIAKSDAGKLHAYEDLVKSGLTYLTGAWKGPLLEAPTPKPFATKSTAAGREDTVEVVESRAVDGALWLRVKSKATCGDPPPKVVLEGWVPAHAESGEPTVWFSSRGC